MAPIHDTDIASERWSRAEWAHYELWEKIDLRFRRRRRLWIAATLLVFVTLSAVPTLIDRWPKWTALSAARRIAREVNQVKREAALAHTPYRLRFLPGGLEYVVERAADCRSPAAAAVFVRKGSFANPLADLHLMTSLEGTERGFPGLIDSFCFDPLFGADLAAKGMTAAGIGLIPAKDLTGPNADSKRKDRIALVVITEPSSEISFE